jgi:hypothetical protein
LKRRFSDLRQVSLLVVTGVGIFADDC